MSHVRDLVDFLYGDEKRLPSGESPRIPGRFLYAIEDELVSLTSWVQLYGAPSEFFLRHFPPDARTQQTRRRWKAMMKVTDADPALAAYVARGSNNVYTPLHRLVWGQRALDDEHATQDYLEDSRKSVTHQAILDQYENNTVEKLVYHSLQTTLLDRRDAAKAGFVARFALLINGRESATADVEHVFDSVFFLRFLLPYIMMKPYNKKDRLGIENTDALRHKAIDYALINESSWDGEPDLRELYDGLPASHLRHRRVL